MKFDEEVAATNGFTKSYVCVCVCAPAYVVDFISKIIEEINHMVSHHHHYDYFFVFCHLKIIMSAQ